MEEKRGLVLEEGAKENLNFVITVRLDNFHMFYQGNRRRFPSLLKG